MFTLNEKDKNILTNRIEDNFWNAYVKLANDVIAGKYGNGEERITAIKAMGFDYFVVQTIVNYMLLEK